MTIRPSAAIRQNYNEISDLTGFFNQEWGRRSRCDGHRNFFQAGKDVKTP